MATFVDDYSRKKFTYLMKTKSKESALRVLKLFHNEVLDPIGVKMQILRTDNDGAFVNDEVIDYLCDLHVVREYTSDYTPQQNGVVETAIRDIKNLAVTLMNAANLHTSQASLYGQAILTASVVLNDAPHAGNGYKSPNEVLGEKGIPLAMRYQFGSHAVVKSEDKALLASKVHECIFVGYTSNKPSTCLTELLQAQYKADH